MSFRPSADATADEEQQREAHHSGNQRVKCDTPQTRRIAQRASASQQQPADEEAEHLRITVRFDHPPHLGGLFRPCIQSHDVGKAAGGEHGIGEAVKLPVVRMSRVVAGICDDAQHFGLLRDLQEQRRRDPAQRARTEAVKQYQRNTDPWARCSRSQPGDPLRRAKQPTNGAVSRTPAHSCA
jgi:hypothetical protein